MEKSSDVSLVTFLGDEITMTSLKWRHNWFVYKFDIVIVSLTNHNLAKSCNFRTSKSKIKSGSGG